jgi:hypothetical protein
MPEAWATANIVRMNRVSLALAVAALAAACASPAAPSTRSPLPTPLPTAATTTQPTAGVRTAAQPLMRGEVFTMNADREMVTFFADRGSLVTRATREGPAPYHSTIQRAEPSTGKWRTVFEDDAAFSLEKVSSGRMAMAEYRAEPMSSGAYDVTVVIIDLGSGQKQNVDHFALSSATYHGGGGGPRRAAGGLTALGSSNIAWTHLYELADGVVEAELRVAPLSDLGSATKLGRSREWIEPISIDDQRLIYVVGGTDRDDLRARDLATGRERSLTALRAPTQSAGRDGPAVSGIWAGWLERPPMAGAPDTTAGSPTTTTFRAVSVETGELRERDLGPDYCRGLSANAGHFVWECGTPTAKLQAFDPNTWTDSTIVVAGSSPLSLAAVGGGFIWREAVAGAGIVTLFTPAVSSAPAPPLSAPTYARWAVDKSEFADRPFILVLFFDGGATNFRIVDASGQVMFRVPIAGSGVFGPESCMVRARGSGPAANATWILLDNASFVRFTSDADAYRGEADSLGRTVTLPLTDTGCRPR